MSKPAEIKRKLQNKRNSFSQALTVSVSDLNTNFLFVKNAKRIDTPIEMAFAIKY
ncbi:hypothetical protein NY10_1253 [Carnobacterium antarcticum]|nr:hypothetical protein NY10_1253 [Carnobacterium sp. CP1]